MTLFESTLENFGSNLWQYHVPVPDDIALSLIEGENRRVICTLDTTPGYHAALMKCKDYWFILVNQKLRNELGKQEGHKVKVGLEKDNSTYGHEMPEELQVLLDQDPEAFDYFDSLTKGKQRSLIYIVTRVKNSDSRLKKALAITSHLKLSKGQLDFKQLNEQIKYFNNL
ncbi:YdeI/OmpD-associated family protein [Pleomorphovibrio marinus]|uniref:YdeI/OmpD-associated family protein n=1 Tax=Pleomorphovibrio marinus TaxID=2164132 RepID=UPI000E0C83E6|nr:YdeI/OmpD-associated family protein [Pleomorphovibrio marinus]